MADTEAAHALISLVQPSSPPRVVMPTTKDLVQTTPDQKFRMTRIKRNSCDEMEVTYVGEGGEFTLPVRRGEGRSTFEQRRNKAARLLMESNRQLVYLTWAGGVRSMVINLSDWTCFHKTVHQERYQCDGLQLVIVRMSCTAQRRLACRTCSNSHWRSPCERIALLYFVLPMPYARNLSKDALDAQLDRFDSETYDMTTDLERWSARVPQVAVRSTISAK